LAEDRTATGWNRLGQYVGTDVLNRVRSWLGPTNSENTENSDPVWEVPIPLTELPRPPFPTDIFPNWVRAYVEAVAAATQTPPDLAAMLVLAALAAACSKRVIVQITSDWSEPVNLFIVTAMASGERKSAVFQEVTQPIMAFEVAELARLAPLIAEAESRRKITEQALAKAQRDAAHATGSEHASLLTTADALAREIAAMKVTAPPRLVVDDCSPERLASLLAEQRGRIAVMAPEGDVFDLMAGRYSATGMPNFGVYLRSHAGDDLRVDRVGRPSEVVRSPALTMGLAVQPEVIRGLTTHPGFRGRGLLGRPLYALPESLIGRRASDPPAVPVDTRSTYHRNLTALLKMEPDTGTDEWGHPKPRRLALSAEAAARFRTFRTELEPRLGELGDLGDIRDWAGKLAGAVARIAGLLHIAEYTDQSTPWSEPISDDTICAAIRLGQEFLIPHAQAAFAQMGADPAVADAQHVLRVLADRDLEQFTKRDLFQVVKGRFKSVEPLGRALTVLEDHGYIRARPEIDRPGPGRRPSPTFDVNPLRRPDRTNTFGQPSTDPPSDRPEDAGFSARELTLAQNAHNSQNALLGDCEQDCEDSEDCEEPATQQEIMEWAAAL
jgi:hypothetical protein